MENFGHTKRGYPLYPRNRGALADIEKSQSYQTVSSYCVDSRPAPYSMQSLICSGVIDFGISALIEGQILQDLLLSPGTEKLQWIFENLVQPLGPDSAQFVFPPWDRKSSLIFPSKDF